MERKRIIIIGFVGFLAIFLFFWGMSFLKGRNIFKKEKNYYAIYQDVGGLDVGSAVTFKGYRVGQVKEVEFNDIRGTELIITFNIDKDIKIPIGSAIEIYSADLLGTKALRIIPSDETDFHIPGDTIISQVQVSMLDEVTNQINPLKEKTEELMGSIDSVVDVLNQILVKNENSISSSLTNINDITRNFEALSISLNKMVSSPNSKLNLMLTNLQSISEMLKESEPDLKNAIANFSNISDSLAAANLTQTIEQTNFVLNNLNGITEKINNGEGSLGQLVTNDSLYINIEDLSRDLDLLIQDIKDSPQKYFKLSVIDMSKTTNKN